MAYLSSSENVYRRTPPPAHQETFVPGKPLGSVATPSYRAAFVAEPMGMIATAQAPATGMAPIAESMLTAGTSASSAMHMAQGPREVLALLRNIYYVAVAIAVLVAVAIVVLLVRGGGSAIHVVR